jgi:hypothetical protein
MRICGAITTRLSPEAVAQNRNVWTAQVLKTDLHLSTLRIFHLDGAGGTT